MITTTTTDTTFEMRFQRIESLIHNIEASAEPAIRANVEELLQLLLELHGAGLERILELIWEAGQPGQTLIQEHLAQDDQVSSLLLLHGLHPLDLETRVNQALEQIGPTLQAQGSHVELLAITAADVVQLRVIDQPGLSNSGGCHSCSSSRVNPQELIEETIFASAPEVAKIEIEGLPETRSQLPIDFIPLIQL